MTETQTARGDFGIERHALQQYRALCDSTPGLRRVWIFGSRARGDWRERSDIDLAIDAPDWGKQEFRQFADALARLPVVYAVDAVHWQDKLTQPFAERIERDRKVFWEPRRHSADIEEVGSTQLKPFQSRVLGQLGLYLTELKKHQTQSHASHGRHGGAAARGGGLPQEDLEGAQGAESLAASLRRATAQQPF
jgi:type III restriction enzyme